MADVVKVNYQTIPHRVEAWFYSGQPYEEMPDWIRACFTKQEMMGRVTGRYAIRDGQFYRWMDADEFNRKYERITP